MKVLDLFSGTQSLKTPVQNKGWEYFSVDNRPESKPDLVLDLSSAFSGQIPFNPDIIWASPPCTCFSVSSIGKHWAEGYTPKSPEAKDSIILMHNLVKLINDLKPKFFFVENPRGMLRKLDILIGERNTVTYCQYGFDRMKPTDIWTNNLKWNPRPACKNGDLCHISAPRGSRTGTQGRSLEEKWSVPKPLLEEILNSCQVN